MRGDCRPTCRFVTRRPQSTLCRAAWRPQSVYLPPRRVCEAAVALPATWMPQSFYLPPRRVCEAALVLPAASPWMRGGCRITCDFQARRPKSSYLLPRRGCETAVALPATLKTGGRSRSTCRLDLEFIGGGSRPTCRLAVNARWRPPYLLLCCLKAAVVLLAALPWIRGGCRTACVRSLSPEAYVDLPAALPWMRGGDRLACDLDDRRAK